MLPAASRSTRNEAPVIEYSHNAGLLRNGKRLLRQGLILAMRNKKPLGTAEPVPRGRVTN
jgi:hypothetical protein